MNLNVLDIIWVFTYMAFCYIRDDISSKEARRQISLLTSYGGLAKASPNYK